MDILADKDLRNCLKKAFPEAFINMANEFIVYPPQNTYFLLDNVSSEHELKCKILEWCSREAHKSVNKKSKEYHFDGINTFLGSLFTDDDMEIIYTKLGNSVNRELTVKFIDSGYDITVLQTHQ